MRATPHRAALLLCCCFGALAACTTQAPAGAQVVVSPATVTLAQGAQQQFSATVSGADQAVSWTVSPLEGGVVTSEGLYTAPMLTGTFFVRAVSLADATSFGVAAVTVLASDAGPIDAGTDAGPDDAGSGDAGSDAGSGMDAGPNDGGLVFMRFSASPVSIARGQSTTLSWDVSGATGLTLQQVGQGSMSVSGTSLQVTPAASATYLLTATSGSASITLPASVTVYAAQAPPLIEQLGLDSSLILRGNSTTLRWAVANGTQLSITNVGVVQGSGTQVVSPTQSTTYTLSATSAGGSASASVVLQISAAPLLTPVPPGGGDVQLSIDSSQDVHPISPDIYGYNADISAEAPPGTSMLRRGDARFTAYNWETNASNEGAAGRFANDNSLDGGANAAGALLPTLASADAGSLSPLLTIPIQGWVAADKSGPVDPAAPDTARFLPSAPRKIASFNTGPDLTDGRVFDDEFAHALAQEWRGASLLRLALDDEPDLWSTVHAEVEKSPVTYQELFDKSVGAAAALKDAAPAALVQGPVLSGWSGFVDLQGASDAAGRDFVDAYLQTMQRESAAEGRRLLDVLDLHWISEATAGSVRVTADTNTAAVQAARVQAPRSLWDPNYVEASPITASGVHDSTGGQAIQLLPRMLAKIAADFPGTRLALSAYSHGGGDDISGALAEADALGIFAQQGLDAAAYQPLLASEPYTAAAFRAYRDYDGAGDALGNNSISATSSNTALVSIYASMNSGVPQRLYAVIINRDTVAHTAALSLHHSAELNNATVWQVTKPAQAGATVAPVETSDEVPFSGFNATTLTLPAQSISTVVLQ